MAEKYDIAVQAYKTLLIVAWNSKDIKIEV